MMEQLKDYRLPRAFGEKWLQALKSGDYAKGICALAVVKEGKKPKFCCLGVACVLEGMTPDELKQYGVIMSTESGGFKVPGGIPLELQGSIAGNPLVARLTSVNDNSERNDFKDVTTWIKENVEFYDPQINQNG